jgi:hypothetical protein
MIWLKCSNFGGSYNWVFLFIDETQWKNTQLTLDYYNSFESKVNWSNFVEFIKL